MRRVATCLLAVLVLFAALAAATLSSSSADITSRAAFAAWATKFGKVYADDAAREAAYGRYMAAAQALEETRRRNPLARFELTARADAKPALFRNAKLAEPIRHRGNAARARRSTVGEAPSALDWRLREAVAPVPNMGQCGGACVTFVYSGIGAAINRIRGYSAELTPLSAQQPLDCDVTQECGCDEGCMLDAPYRTLAANGGAWDTAASYPYTDGSAMPHTCAERDSDMVVGGRIRGIQMLPKHSEGALVNALMENPVGVTVYSIRWDYYTGGVMTDCGSGANDNAALLVGYNDTAPTPYWIVRSNWGADWGEDGYIYISKGNNTCGITDEPFTLEMAPV
eukprot:CAMPEP_0174830728 /NCGR_PEP_ID=MMETSP1114-20130205/2686_1 /TAXON_ID=312471 /ORGANISM="Neobodo designis, Strain CCAP 1951/1" /LENGTH=340 /DNA_ID=CAMNT_0016064531 /DNA_START=29 /DNA_END=1051 /DNA_ORIENTATION=-